MKIITSKTPLKHMLAQNTDHVVLVRPTSLCGADQIQSSITQTFFGHYLVLF